jgi:hypothetical protein
MPPEMKKNTEAVQMMNRCKQEILGLRAVIARLEPKADAYDNLVRMLRRRAAIRRSRVAGPRRKRERRVRRHDVSVNRYRMAKWFRIEMNGF